MARYRLLITLAIVSLAFATYGDQPVFAPRDPSAARKDFSNVDPSTAIDALNLGTMATEASADYVATGTFTGHTDATAAHGVSEVADAADIPANSDFTLAGLSEKSYNSLTDKPTFGTMASETATTYLKVADLPPYPTNASFTLAGLSEKSYWSLADRPTFGTMASETATDYTKTSDLPDFAGLSSAATGNATFSYTFDVATLTVGGVDVLGDVHSALAEILGE